MAVIYIQGVLGDSAQRKELKDKPYLCLQNGIVAYPVLQGYGSLALQKFVEVGDFLCML